MDEPHFLQELNDALASKLGRAVWAFAEIEWLTYVYLRELCNEDLLKLVGDQNFSSRVKILKKLVGRTRAPVDETDRAKSLLAEAEQLVQSRNTLIHNPWQVYIDLDQMDFVTRIFKYTNQNTSLNEDDVEKFAERAEGLAKSLKEALSELTNSSTGRS